MKTIMLILPLLFYVGCDDPKPAPVQEHVVIGYVRNVWCGSRCNVVFETDDGKLLSLDFGSIPPVWAGLHCQLNYHDNPPSNFDSAQKLDYVGRK